MEMVTFRMTAAMRLVAGTVRDLREGLRAARRRDLSTLEEALWLAYRFDMRTKYCLIERKIRVLEGVRHG